MATVPVLSDRANQRILDALEKVADYTLGGSAPNEAIKKAALEKQVPAAHVPLMAYAYNSAQTNARRIAGQSTLEKAANFELADPDKVVAELFPSTVKSAAQIHTESVISPDYESGPAWISRLTKEATLEPKLLPVPDAPPVTKPVEPAPETLTSAENEKRLSRARKRKETARMHKTAAYDRLGTAYDKLRVQLHMFGNAPLPHVKKAVAISMPEAATRLLDKIIAGSRHLQKQAAAELHPRALVVFDDSREPYRSLCDCLTAVESVKQAKLAYDEAAAEEAAANAFFRQPAQSDSQPDDGFIYGSVLGTVGGPVKQADDDHSDAHYALLGAAVPGVAKSVAEGFSGNVADSLTGKSTGDLVQDKVKELDDPSHSMRLAQIKTQAVLNDMIANDPIISTYDSEDTMRLFNQLSMLSPTLARQPLVVQSFLRQGLANGGYLDPFQLEQLGKLDSSFGVGAQVSKRQQPLRVGGAK